MFDSGLAFVDPLTPIVALWDLDEISFRRYDRSGDYNDASNWTPPVAVGRGDEPDLAGGLRGVYLSYETATGQVISRYDPTGRPVRRRVRAAQQISDGEGETNLTATSTRARAGACTRPGRGPATRRSSSAARSTGSTGCRPRRSPTTRTAGATSSTSTWRPPATAAASPSGTTRQPATCARSRSFATATCGRPPPARALQGAGRARGRDRARGLLPAARDRSTRRRGGAHQRDRPERPGEGHDRRRRSAR